MSFRILRRCICASAGRNNRWPLMLRESRTPGRARLILFPSHASDSLMKEGIYMVLTLHTGNTDMRYIRFGKGLRPLVILPGISAGHVTDAGDALAAAFSAYTDDFTLYLFDRRETMPEDFTVADMTRDTAGAMASLGISGADVYGASQGGMIALALAGTHPGLVHAAAVACTSLRCNPSLESCMRRWSATALSGDAEALADICMRDIWSPAAAEAYGSVLRAPFLSASPEDLRRLVVLCNACLSADVTSEASCIRCPVFAFGCEGDRVMTADATREIASALHCESLICGPEYGHAAYDESPDFLPRMLAFFRAQE